MPYKLSCAFFPNEMPNSARPVRGYGFRDRYIIATNCRSLNRSARGAWQGAGAKNNMYYAMMTSSKPTNSV